MNVALFLGNAYCSVQELRAMIHAIGISLVTQTVKNLFVMQESWVRSLGWEDPLEEGMATHSSILAWRIPVDRGAWQATVHGVAKSLSIAHIHAIYPQIIQGKKKYMCTHTYKNKRTNEANGVRC